ncbi:hypothetical protein HDU87_003763 [Geranomyces variabilis]|uniref:Uncharacterized protein n=1 Tax=Geranomyces variabilis TaxID=109894 RepID=A0AAD5XSE6_9FUNG|nr:hypothetical protein HDU87_003763 [Geranomyces variabilis]
MASDEDIRMMEAMGLPVGFGAKSKKEANKASADVRAAKAFEETRRKEEPAAKNKRPPKLAENAVSTKAGTPEALAKPPRKPGLQMDSSDEDEDDSSDSGSDSEAEKEDALPISHQAALKDHHKTVSALSLDPAGARFATGSRDCMVKLWDFHGMDASLKPFRSFEATSGNPIRDIQFSMGGDQILVASSATQAKLYDRDGLELVEYSKGDPYIRDMRHTKGHVAALTSCKWNPVSKSTFITSSLDSTIRIWETGDKRSHKQVIAVKSKQPGGKTSMTSAAYSHDGRLIAGGAADGILRIWASNSSFLTPTHSIDKAHMSGAAMTSVCFSRSNSLIASRAMDDTLKLWDMRKLKTPVAVVSDLVNFFEETEVIFSPDDRHILTGTSVKKDMGAGKLCVFNSDLLAPVTQIEAARSSVVRVQWNARINQILTGTGDGSVQVFYDPLLSVSGVKAALSKRPKQRQVDEIDFGDDANRTIITPHSLPMFKDDQAVSSKRRREKLRADPAASRKPDQPLTGPGRGGKVGTSITQHMMKGLIKDTLRDEDPREAILRHAKGAEENPYWVAPAYKKTQPQTKFADQVYEDETEAAQAAAKKRRK